MSGLPTCCARLRVARSWKLLKQVSRFSSSVDAGRNAVHSDKQIGEAHSSNCEEDASKEANDFFGFGGEDVVEVRNPKKPDMARLRAWHEQLTREKNAEAEKMHVANYGTIRLDSENVPTYASLRNSQHDEVQVPATKGRSSRRGLHEANEVEHDLGSVYSNELQSDRRYTGEDVAEEVIDNVTLRNPDSAKSFPSRSPARSLECEPLSDGGSDKIPSMEHSIGVNKLSPISSSTSRRFIPKETSQHVTSSVIELNEMLKLESDTSSHLEKINCESINVQNALPASENGGRDLLFSSRSNSHATKMLNTPTSDMKTNDTEDVKLSKEMLETPTSGISRRTKGEEKTKHELQGMGSAKTNAQEDAARISVLKSELMSKPEQVIPDDSEDLSDKSESYIDHLYFRELLGKDVPLNSSAKQGTQESDEDLGYIDKQYFSSKVKGNRDGLDYAASEFTESEKHGNHHELQTSDDLNYFDEQMFSARRGFETRQVSNQVTSASAAETTEDFDDAEPVDEIHLDEHLAGEYEDVSEKVSRKEPMKSAKETFETAFDYVKKLRKEKAVEAKEPNDVDSARAKLNEIESSKDTSQENEYWVLERQPVDLEKLPEHEVFAILKRSIIYNRDGIVAINKPYGLLCQKGEPYHHYLQRYLPDLAKVVRTDKLHQIHRLDRGTTGVLLLAKDIQTATRIRKLFKEHKVQKVYWAITRGVPSPPEGIINIPIAEGAINGDRRMVLKPELDEEQRQYFKDKTIFCSEAVTYYKVLSSTEHAALVHIKPHTGVKHQVRVHLGFGMSCPIIGDHKYTSLAEMKPQKLHHKLLTKLKVKQSKVRNLPLYLFARMIVIPEINDGQNVYVMAHPPKHFTWAKKRLGLSAKVQ